MISPVTCVQRRRLAQKRRAKKTLDPPQGPVAPISSVIAFEKSAVRASRRPAAFNSRRRRSLVPVSDHAGKARSAASTTFETSASLAAAASLATAPVTGLRRVEVAPDAAATGAHQ